MTPPPGTGSAPAAVHLLIVGPPGSGKGTQAALLGRRLGIPHVSTGQMLRDAADAGTIDPTVAQMVRSGGYVPDGVMDEVVGARLAAHDAADGAVLDGYPRTVAQIDALDRLLAARGSRVRGVLHLKVPDAEVVRRMLDRARTGGRDDDTAGTIRARLDTYWSQTAPVVAVYAGRGVLHSIDGSAGPDDVARQITTAVG